MSAEITMPQLTDTMTEGTVVKWLKKEGEKVKSGDVIAEVETDKAVMEQESFEAGTLAALLIPEGQKATVGQLMAVLATGKEDPAAIKQKYRNNAAPTSTATAPAPSAAAEKSASPATPRAAQGGAAAHSTGATATLEAASTSEVHESADVGHHATRGSATPVPALPNNGNGHDRIFASPLARRIAADHQVELSDIQGTGPGGRIVQRDVLAFTARPPQAAAEPKPQDAKGVALPSRVARGETEVIPLTKMRSAIAVALQRSKQNIPHFYVTIDVDVEQISTLRARLNKQLESQGIKISLNDFVSKAVASALLAHPAVNAHWTGDSITRFGDVHLGIAVAIPDGLIVPVLKNADQMGLKELQQRTAELAKKAKAQRLRGEEMKGATFSISNLGMFGVSDFSAIINPPEVGILAVSAAEKRAVVRGDQIVARTMMTLTLSVDHRAVDGATAAEFMRTLKGLLEEPGMMLV